MKTKILFIFVFVSLFCINVSAQISYNINQVNGQTISGCNFMLYDSGGPNGNYGNSENYTVTFCSGIPGTHLNVNIIAWQVESATFDNLTIYNGPTASGSTLLNNAGGTTMPIPNSFESSGECVTFKWHTDGSVTYSGFAISISCAIPCQDFNFTVNNIQQGDTTFLDICTATALIAIGNYPNNGVNYQQSDATTTWLWDINYMGQHQLINGVGNNFVNPNFGDGGGYLVTVTAMDINGCTYTHTPVRVRVALEPVFSGSFPDSICPGEPFSLSGGHSGGSGGGTSTTINFDVEPWEFTEPEILFETHCFMDNLQGIPQCANFTYTSFNPTCVINSVNDIESIVIYMEHSYIGDLSMYVTCPNGSQVNLIQYGSQSCGPAYLGMPIDDYCGLCDSNCAIDPNTGNPINGGTVLPYTWAPNGTMTLSQACSGYYSATVPNSTILLPTNGFAPFIGCPLNGTWSVCIVDNLSVDDGYVNQFEIHFNQSVIDSCSQSNTWVIDPTFNEGEWTTTSNANVIISGNGAITATSATSGDVDFTYTVTDDFGCTHDTTIYVHIRDITDPQCCQFPTPNAGPDASVCTNTYTFNASMSNGTSCQWTVATKPAGAPDPIINNATSPNATVNVGTYYGTYTFVFTETNVQPTCFTTDTVAISFNLTPTSTFVSSPIMCYGGFTTINYTGNMTEADAATFNWNFDGGIVISGSGRGPYQIAWGQAGVHPVTLTVSRNGCTSTTTTVNILTPTLLNMSLAHINVSCFGACNGSATATVTGGTAPYQYSWNSGTAINSNMCNADYELIVTDANGCTVSDNFTITQPDELVITQSSFSNLSCYNAYDGEINITFEGGTAPHQFHWSDGAITLNRVSIAAGNYSITITDAHGCSVSTSFIITQPDELMVVVNNDMILCEGQQAIIQANGQGGTLPYTYNWSKTPNPNNYFVSTQSLTETPDTTTVYRVYITDANGCISNIAIMKITVSPDIVIDTLIAIDNSCFNSCDGHATVLFHGGLPPYNYSWASNNYQLHDLCKGTYSLTITDVVGCYETTSFIIDEPSELVYSTYSTPATCYGISDGLAQISVQYGTGTQPYTYLWPDGQTTHIVNLPAGNFTVTVFDANNCRTTVPFTIEQPTQLYTEAIPNRTICENQHVQLITQTTGGTQYYDYHWTDNFGTNHYSNTWDVYPTQTTTYYLTVTDANGCTYSPVPTTLTINPPVDIIYIQSNPSIICPGQSTEITVEVQGGNGGPYLMRIQDGTIVGSPFIISPTETTKYVITVEDMCGSPDATDSVVVEVRPTPLKNFTAGPLYGCPPLQVQFFDQTETAFDQYYWNFGDNAYSTERNATHIYTTTGTYDVFFEIRDAFGCTYRKFAPQLIEVYPKPKSVFAMTPENINSMNTEIVFTNLSEGATEYFWSFGDGDSSIYVNPSHIYMPDTLLYKVFLIAENDYNCMDTSWREIRVENLYEFYMPTSFTPNGDNHNDCFKPCAYGISTANFLLTVHDRFGNVIFRTNIFVPTESVKDCDACTDGAWNGRINNTGKMLENGSYVWHCEFEDEHGIKYSREGVVTLLR